ncbi:MAG: hypothetical protein N2690_10710 [Rhodocyclaceae bacterium]|nr:hypothetical protein [Rhodocyclaceae bacterium]
MEGDLLGPLAAQLVPWGVALASTVLGAWWALLKWFAARLLNDIEKKLSRIDALSHEVDRVDADLKRLMAEMPIHYQRREDAIREYTAMNAKLDRIWEALLEVRNAR